MNSQWSPSFDGSLLNQLHQLQNQSNRLADLCGDQRNGPMTPSPNKYKSNSGQAFAFERWDRHTHTQFPQPEFVSHSSADCHQIQNEHNGSGKRSETLLSGRKESLPPLTRNDPFHIQQQSVPVEVVPPPSYIIYSDHAIPPWKGTTTPPLSQSAQTSRRELPCVNSLRDSKSKSAESAVILQSTFGNEPARIGNAAEKLPAKEFINSHQRFPMPQTPESSTSFASKVHNDQSSSDSDEQKPLNGEKRRSVHFQPKIGGHSPHGGRTQGNLVEPLLRRTSTEARRKLRRTSTGTVLRGDNALEPIMCEVEYPWMCDKPILFLSALPEDELPDYLIPERLSRSKMIEADLQMMDRIHSILGLDVKQGQIKTALCANDEIVGTFWKIIFNNVMDCRKAKKSAAKRNDQHGKSIDNKSFHVTFTSPGAAPRSQSHIFVTNFERDDAHELMNVLEELSIDREKPIDITRLAADYNPKQPNSKKLTWRVTYDTEESARNALAMVHLRNAKRARATEGKKKDKPNKPGFEASYQPNPFTKGLVICFRSPGMSKIVFQKLKLYAPATNCLVEEFKYALQNAQADDKLGRDAQEKGDITYDVDSGSSVGQGYARLVSQNWWYTALFWALIFAGLALMDLYSNLIYAASLFAGTGFEYNTDYRYNFVLSFFGLQGFLLASCWRQSKSDINIQLHSSGDLLMGKTWVDRVLLHSASFTFFFVQIPGMVKDIIKTLHPWTNVQEKAAAKMCGARLFLIGFPNAQMYRVSDQMGFHTQFPPIILSRFVLTLFKVVHAYSSGSWSSIFLCLAGVVLWPMQFLSCKTLLDDRSALCEFLKQQAHRLEESATDLEDLRSRKEFLRPEAKGFLGNWEKHFGNFRDLTKYNRGRDVMPFGFWVTIFILGVANAFIAFLHTIGVLKSGNGDEVPATPVLALFSTLTAADLDGDGILSSAELAHAPAAVRKLAALAQNSFGEWLPGNSTLV